MSQAENWTLITDVDDDTPAIDRFLIRRIAEKLQSKWNTTDRVIIEVKKGPNWMDSGKGIALPEGRKGVTPEGGARHLVAMARVTWDAHDGRARIRVHALGESQSGGTSKGLWTQGVDFTELDDEDSESQPEDGKAKRAKVFEEVAAWDQLRETANDARGAWNTAVDKIHTMADKITELSSKIADNNTGLLEAMRLDYRDKQEAREAAAREADAERSARRVDKLFDKGVDVVWGLAEKYMAEKMGVSKEAFSGSYSSRLQAILKDIPQENLAKCRAVVGEQAWSIFEDAAKGVSDEVFRQLAQRAIGELPRDASGSHAGTFQQLAAAIGNMGSAMALAKLLQEATD